MVDVETQTDTKLLEYIAELDAALLEAYKTIAELNNQIDQLEVKCSDYRHLWMSECRYSSILIKEGAEPAGGVSQVKDWENSSPYHRYCRMFLSLFQLSEASQTHTCLQTRQAQHLEGLRPDIQVVIYALVLKAL